MNIGTPIQDTRGEPGFIESPEIPGWLFDELLTNPAFVLEAIENTEKGPIASAWLADNTGAALFDATHRAVSEWIAHCWQATDYDAACLSRVWRENAEEAKENQS